MDFEIIALRRDNAAHIEQAAALMVAEFAAHWPHAWPDMEAGREEVHGALQPENITLAAVLADDTLAGWIGGIPAGYDGNVWELHPLVVGKAYQGRGIGRGLVGALEAEVRQRGGLTLTLGTDDEDNMTSLAGVNLYENTWEHIRNIRNLKGHPYEFYQKCGFVITGVVPDANGRGKPDILMAKGL